MASIKEILEQEDFNKVVSDLCVDTLEDRDSREYLDEYNGKRNRRTTSVDFRENKKVAVYSDTETEINSEGEVVSKRLEDKIVTVAKIRTNIPKKIVRTASAFLFGGDMNITADNIDDGSLEEFRKVFERKLKMKSILMKFARVVLSETKGAIVFYPKVRSEVIGLDENAKPIFKKTSELKVKILSLPKDENVEYEFYPHFDEDDDMDAFIHKYSARNARSYVECVKIYTADTIISASKENGQWTVVGDKNLFGKIPVVYAEVDKPEWEEIAILMDHYEMRLSRNSDTNDYFGDPMLKTYGVTNLPSKDTVGKELNFSIEVDPDTGTSYHGDAEFLAWQQSIDSQKEEISNLRHEIFSGASCPDLSFDTLLGVGDLSGVAREFMTLDAKIKATEQMEVFGPVVQRCVAIVQAGMSKISHVKGAEAMKNNYFEVSFGSILPKSLEEEITNLSTAAGGKPINSQETITARSPFTKNVKEEVAKMKSEAEADAVSSNPFGSTFQ